ncbi:hypothetical protein R1flu_018856 [Riccia fluitans]|uniref:Uncharacterized protein n=1 Tax=Riccia fluitans TaxID=41844 RepID=A0ABD1ZH10_9MARC
MAFRCYNVEFTDNEALALYHSLIYKWLGVENMSTTELIHVVIWRVPDGLGGQSSMGPRQRAFRVSQAATEHCSNVYKIMVGSYAPIF